MTTPFRIAIGAAGLTDSKPMTLTILGCGISDSGSGPLPPLTLSRHTWHRHPLWNPLLPHSSLHLPLPRLPGLWHRNAHHRRLSTTHSYQVHRLCPPARVREADPDRPRGLRVGRDDPPE